MTETAECPSEWEEKFSTKHNTPYWYNRVTSESVWTRPATAKRERPDTIESSNVKRSRSEFVDARLASMVKSSYQPPVSGAAEDILRMKSKPLTEPRIIPDLPNSTVSMWERDDIMVNEYLARVYKEGSIEDKKGIKQKFKDITNPVQGRHLYNLITENKFTRTLEVGLAMGASAVWITQAHRDVNDGGVHYAIDPNQTNQYDNMGELLVERCGLDSYLNVIEKTSYRALPTLLEQVLAGSIPKFHLIYIDGWHTFDYTLVDFFYADLLLETNGVIVLDDIKHRPVRKSLDFIKVNYPHYKVVPKTPCYRPPDAAASSQATFIKLSDDSRTWNHYVDF